MGGQFERHRDHPAGALRGPRGAGLSKEPDAGGGREGGSLEARHPTPVSRAGTTETGRERSSTPKSLCGSAASIQASRTADWLSVFRSQFSSPSARDPSSAGALPMIAQVAAVVGAILYKISLIAMPMPSPFIVFASRTTGNGRPPECVTLLELLTAQYGIAESRLPLRSPALIAPKPPNDTEEGTRREIEGLTR
jgi:hypothetical protein